MWEPRDKQTQILVGRTGCKVKKGSSRCAGQVLIDEGAGALYYWRRVGTIQLVTEQKLVLFISSSIVGQEKGELPCQENINHSS